MQRPRNRNVDLNLLRVFDAVYQQGTVSAAAQEIGVSSSAISHALSRLRYIFGDELFIKTSKGMIPTARAAEIADGVANALMQMNAVFEPLEFKPESADRHFRIRCNQSFAYAALSPVIEKIREERLATNLTIQCDDLSGVAAELDTGALDLALSTFVHIPERFDSQILFADHWVWVMGKNNPASHRNLTDNDLLAMPQLVLATPEAGKSIDGHVTEDGLERGVVNAVFLGDVHSRSRYRRSVNGAVMINDVLLMPRLLLRSDLVAMMPASLARSVPEADLLKIIKPTFQDGQSFEHRMVWHRKHGRDPAIVWLRSMISQALAAQGTVDAFRHPSLKTALRHDESAALVQH